jgi:hypothetical protein
MHLKSSLAKNDSVLTPHAINLTINDSLFANQCLLHLR